MEAQVTWLTSPDEQTLIHIARRLPPARTTQLLDFARFLEYQVQKESSSGGDDKWDELLAQPESVSVLREMASEAREDYYAGRTTDIDDSNDDRLSPA